ncbi:hypothetical protein [Caballeronia ptereochthonis]|uniref:Lipoprotein n=1 Tax=Caballeronia ptereochthonis TaxID=1777144 RepID=A0A158B7N7_9BURK|nr:hypothetical protein [Caballeronia ptereochthonis]SAK65920.1 hypothetical protein AWB83_02894 [Caballeronia ptereochthonis]
MKTSSLRWLAALGCAMGASAFGQTAAPCPDPGSPSAAKLVFVRDFTPVSEGGAPHLPGSRLRAARNAMRVNENASALSEGIVKALNARGIAACHATAQTALPASGWLVNGEFDETLSAGFGSALPSMGSSDKQAPNTHVTVQLADLAASPDKPLAQIDTTDELKGQKSAAAPKPYGAAVRFVINRVEASSSLDDLAGKIADGIVAEKAKLPADEQ